MDTLRTGQSGGRDRSFLKGESMSRLRIQSVLLFVVTSISMFAIGVLVAGQTADILNVVPIEVQVVATGIPGAGAIAQIGTFHLGGPFHDNPSLSPATAPGEILDRPRLFVASTSNFGAPLAREDQAPGAILSIDVSGESVAVPSAFASAGDQASARDGRVRLYTANSPAFLNSVFNPAAVTANELAVSLPLGISLNNAFGRPWFANAPFGDQPFGTITVIDPNGAPFRSPPDPVAGGVFAGNVTNRDASSTHGLTAAALATSLVTKSPDGTGRAVFLAALADGSVVQVHVQKGVDGLAPAGSFTPIKGISTQAAESTDPDAITRVGMVFNWVPNKVIYVTDPLANRILALDISDDGTLFTSKPRYLTVPQLDRPVDIAPTSVEVAARNFASNTTLGGGSDLYILNRGNNTIVRMNQAGKVIAIRHITAPVSGFRAAGIAVSEDGRTIWVTATVPGAQGVILQMPAFGAGDVTPSLAEDAVAAGADGAIAQGRFLFSYLLEPDQRLGPLFNGRSCNTCHTSGGAGTTAESSVLRVGRLTGHAFDPLIPNGGPIARRHSVSELGVPCGLPTGVPPNANVSSVRTAMTLRGTSLIDNILAPAILSVQSAEPEPVRGRANVLPDGRIGRFGWKAQTATLVEFMAEAQRDELGLTNPLQPHDLVSGCRANERSPEADAVPLTSLVAFLNTIEPQAPTPFCLNSSGASLFTLVGCANCHTPSMPGPGSPTASQRPVQLYSDLLLHDMGPHLADNIEQGQATGREFRTMPLWRVSDRPHFLHNGSATTLTDAIRAHGGQGAEAASAFERLSDADKAALLAFLGCI
jgi:mono/diheme cytochrome c family protein